MGALTCSEEEAKDARHAATVEDPFIVCCEELDALREHARHKSMTPTT